ncbi:MAG: FtsK/SpoIIIE domain-containing protein [Acidimicrobiales bacterium]
MIDDRFDDDDERADTYLDVQVMTDVRATVEEVLQAAARVAPAAAEARWCDGIALDPAAAVTASPLRSGAEVSTRHRPPALAVPAGPGTFEVRVAAGPGAGRVVWLPVGDHVIGRQPGSAVHLDHPSVSDRHLTLRVAHDGASVTAIASGAGTRLEDVPLEPGVEVTLPANTMLAVGDVLLATDRVPPPVANLARDVAGAGVVNRTFRDRTPPQPDRIRVPGPEDDDDGGGQSAVEAALLLAGPIVIAVPMALLMHNATMLLIGVMSPMMYGASALLSRRGQGRRRKARKERRLAETNKALAQLAAAAVEEQQYARDVAPDLGALVLTALGARTRLWERREGTPDALMLRVGTHDRPTSAPVEGEVERPLLKAVPATVALGEVGVFGVAGPGREGALRGAVLQLAVLHSPADLSLTVVAPIDADDGWDWVRWLPHLRGPGGTCQLVTRPEHLPAVVEHLEGVLEARAKEQAARSTALRWSPRHVLVVVEAPEHAPLPGLARLAREGPAVGIDLLVSANQVERLPEQRRATLNLAFPPGSGDRGLVGTLEKAGEVVAPLLPDLLDPYTAELAARALAPLRVATAGAGQAIPHEVRLSDLAGGADISPEQVAALWEAAGDELRPVPIGAADGGPLLLDLARQGPHGLVVGTTGSGKSELLLTLVASLALHHPPEVFTTVLVDFKGGTGLDALAPLPHCVGNVSNLEPLQAIRALESLDAELQRRQRLFAARYGEKEFDQAVAAARAMGDAPPARLLVLIDEFAVLREKLPDLVKRLEEIAVVGRSLGVHLLLATQQPGEISPKILDNSPLRIALRVEDPAASTQIIRGREAAEIPHEAKGRAFLSVAGSTTLFQTARTTARRRHPEERPAPVARIESWDAPLRPRHPVGERVAIEDSELRALVDAAVAAHGKRPRPRQVFSAPLPELVALEALADGATARGNGRTKQGGPSPVVVGLEDRPAEQAQVPFTFDLAGGGVLVLGGPSSGRSSALRTVAAALSQAHSPDLVHIHGIDGGTGQLLALDALRHTGVIAGVGEPERVDRLLELLVEEASRRLERLQRSGASDLAEQWALEPSDPLPWLVLLVDGWERVESELRERDAERTWRLLQQVASEGRPAGIVPVVAGSWRTVLPVSPFSSVGQRWVLGYPTASDHQLVDISPRLVPPRQPAGRALLPGRTVRHDGERAVPMPGLAQLAVVGGDPRGAAQANAIAALGKRLKRSAPSKRLIRVDRLPTTTSLAEALALDAAANGSDAGSDLPVLVGVGGDHLVGHYVDLAATPAFVVAGPERSGRTTALISMAQQAAVAGAGLILVHPRRSLAALQSHPATVASFTGAAALGTDAADRFEAVAGPCVLVIDDADGLRTLIERLSPAPGPDPRGILVAALTDTIREYWFERLRAGRSGLLLHPRAAYDGEPLGRRLTSSTVITRPKGRGHLLALGDDLLIQVPLLSDEGRE